MEKHEERPTVDALVDPHDLAASTPDALIGATLHDTYKVVRVLAEGGMGRVYEATHTRIATKRFAIKVLLAELKHSLDVRLRFRREAEAAASVEHPNVVGVHDFGYAPDGRPYLVCDFLEGRELGDMLAPRVPLPYPLAATIARQLCAALQTAHEKGVIHRDIKPANVFLIGPDDAPQVKILDFGLSKIVELTEAGVTQTGVIMGTPSYMAPEQARGERADHRVDIYGVGAVLYACLTGRPPHEEESAQQTILAVMTREAPRPCSIIPGIPTGLEVVVQRAMANQPGDRYATMRDLDLALLPYDGGERGPMSSRVSSPAPPSVAAGQASVPDLNEADGVRNRAAGWLFLAVLLSLLTATSAALGVLAILAPGRQVMQSELLLVVLAVIGSLFTPAILVTRYIKRKYWNNSVRMVDLVLAVRSPVLAAAFAYGTASLLFRVLDASSAQLAMPIGAPHGSGWLGWAPFFAGVGLVAAITASLRQRLLVPAMSFGRRFLAGPVVVGAGLVGSLTVLYYGVDIGSQARAARQSAVIRDPDELPAGPSASNVTIAGPPKSTPSGAGSAPETSASPPLAPEDKAPADELAKAIAEGTTSLNALQSRFPRDPAVLEAYALALGKDPQRASEMLRVADALFAAAPERANDEKLGKLLLSAALTPSTSQRAIDVMSSRMGVRGAEMLFDIVLSQPEIRPRARAALDTPAVQRVLTPALKISFDLYTAATCEARAKLLPQAERDGDERTVGALTIFTLPTKRPCGFRKQQSCPGPALCAAQVAEFNRVKAAIKARLPPKR
jgi:tRNA A-37 threonylcarbamoyl transferase component Bud32